MNIETFNEEMFNFINTSSCAFTGVKELKRMLLESGYRELQENEKWDLNKDGKYFVTRNDASIIAFNLGSNNSFNITCTHVDTPSFTIKPKNQIYENNYLKINVMPYGGLLNYAWLDEAMSLAGRVIIKNNTTFRKEIIDVKDPLFTIPSVAIHQNASANDDLKINSQIDLMPIFSLSEQKNAIKNLISKVCKVEENEEICDFDLFLYSTSKPLCFGLNKEMIISPRIDDLTCVFSAIKGFIESKDNENNNIFCAFNSEEIGSLTKEGADSSFLMDILKRIAASIDKDISMLVCNSTILSADNTHAIHPNHPGNSDENNSVFLNNGVVISKDETSTTDSITSSIFKDICKQANVPYQDFVTKNDMTSGSTLSGISLRHVSIDSIDIGLAQLAMHGAKEVIGSSDSFYLYKAFKKFYETTIIKEKDKINLIFN